MMSIVVDRRTAVDTKNEYAEFRKLRKKNVMSGSKKVAGHQMFIAQHDHVVLREESTKKCDELLTEI